MNCAGALLSGIVENSHSITIALTRKKNRHESQINLKCAGWGRVGTRRPPQAEQDGGRFHSNSDP